MRFLKDMVNMLGTCLVIPEEEVLTQGESGKDMYYIMFGDCVAS